MTAPRVLVVGEINPDLVLRCADSFPSPGREILVEDSQLTLGSASAICASALARLGNNIHFIGKVGPDLFGRFSLEQMKENGIEVGRVIVDENVKTGITISLTTSSDRALVTHLVAIASLREDDILEEDFDSAEHLHVSAYYLQEALRPGLRELFRRAHRRGLTTSLDPGHDPVEAWKEIVPVLSEVDVFFPNETELLRIAEGDDVEESLRSLSASGSTTTVAKLGADGAAVLVEGAYHRIEARKVDVVDTTGAGDSFDAGFLHAYLRGRPLPDCLRYGVAGGTLSTRALGGTTAQPSLSELEAFLAAGD